MILILLTSAMALLKYFDFHLMEKISWGWIIALLFITILWLEVIERMLGLDKKKAHKKFDDIQKARAKKNFDLNKK